MIRRVASTLPTFKELELGPGLNILVAEKHNRSSNRKTRNRSGKTSLIEVIHFVLGSSIRSDSIFMTSQLKSEEFFLTLDLAGNVIKVGRSPKTPDLITIYSGTLPASGISAGKKSLNLNQRTLDQWKAIIGEDWFSLPQQKPMGRYNLSPRSLVSYFARRAGEGGFQTLEKFANKQGTFDSQASLSYFLDVAQGLAERWQHVRDRADHVKKVQKSFKDGDLGYLVGRSSELRTEVAKAEEEVKRRRKALDEFKIHPEYRNLEKELATLSSQISNLSNQNTLDEENLVSLNESIQNETVPDTQEILRLYREININFPEHVSKRFEDMRLFHESITSNRESYLNTEKIRLNQQLTNRRKKIKSLDTRRKEIMETIRSHGALDQYQKLQLELGKKEAHAEELRKKHKMALELESIKSEAKIERDKLEALLSNDLQEQDEQVKRAILFFEEISSQLYENAGSLVPESTNNGLKLDITIQGKRSGGIKHMQIFTFDMMLIKLCHNRRIGPGFLVHDSHIFDGVDGRQVASALQVGLSITDETGWQYIVTINEDQLESALEEAPDNIEKERIRKAILPTRLKDSPNNGLFGLEF